MKTTALAMPGIAWGSYPERDIKRQSWLSQKLKSIAASLQRRQSNDQQTFVRDVQRRESFLQDLSAIDFAAAVREIKAQLAKQGFVETLLVEAFALIREATRRELGMSQYETQLIAARIMLDNRLVEMATGEGKTITALMTAAAAALSGIPVHVITSNDYLVRRDAEHLGPVYQTLGLTVGYVIQASSREERRIAYSCDVTYCTAKELVFDYLKDRLMFGQRRNDLQRRIAALKDTGAAPLQPLLRGLCMALVDEADSILIDEARTPLILSDIRANQQQIAYLDVAIQLAASLIRNRDFVLHTSTRSAELTPHGREILGRKVMAMSGVWRDRRRREEGVSLALAAKHLFKRDRDYLVREGKVEIIDETTGRVAEGRVWSRGLHQLIERKEGCEPTGEQRAIAQITYQRLFPRYFRLCGMSGTLHEARKELRSVYSLEVSKIQLHQPSKRAIFPVRMMATSQAKWDAVIERTLAMRAQGRPVLIGMDSVSDSEFLSEQFNELNIPHAVLNARQDREEALIVSQAGNRGQITIATNMAGRGTDIPLAPGVVALGGLHVICCQHNSARRIDRQLHGRCARRGDPGSVETILSLDDRLISEFLPVRIKMAICKHFNSNRQLPNRMAQILLYLPQVFEERRHWRQRLQLLEQDALLDRRLSFVGKSE